MGQKILHHGAFLWKGGMVVAPVVLAIAGYFFWHASIDWHDLAGDGLPITVLVGSASYQDANGKCAQLGLLEEKAARNPISREANDYEAALVAWQRDHQGVQPLCRSHSLGRLLLQNAAQMIEAMGPQIDDPWLNSVGEGLVEHLQNKDDCMFFWDRFVPRKFFPTIFHWGEYVDDALVDRLLNDTSENADLYSRLMFNMPPYGAPQIRFRERPQGRYRMAQVEMIAHVRALIRAHKGALGVKQIIEFGGGTGQLAALIQQIWNIKSTLPPTHFIYDFAPMNLVQRYWLAYSGFAGYLGWNSSFGQGSLEGKIVLECSMSSLQSHLDAQQLQNSLFWASFSLTEADLKTRDQFWPIVKQFGVIFISYWANWNGLENDKYLKTKTEEGLQATHNILIWRIPDRSKTGAEHVQNSFYFLAVRKDRANADIQCVRQVGCGQEAVQSAV